MGGSKPFRLLDGRPLIEHAIERSRDQVDCLWLSANANADELAPFGLRVIEDGIAAGEDEATRRGPVGGIAAGLAAAAAEGLELLAVFPCDAPFLPADLVARLAAGLAGTEAPGAVPIVCGRIQPAFGLWRTSALGPMRALLHEGVNKLETVCARLGCIGVEQPAAEGQGLDPWFNVNAPEDLAVASRHLAAAREASRGS